MARTRRNVRRRTGDRKAEAAADAALAEDDIESYHSRRQRERFGGAADADSEEEGSDDVADETVMDLELSSDEEGADDDDDDSEEEEEDAASDDEDDEDSAAAPMDEESSDEEEEEEEDEETLGTTARWGSERTPFYGADTAEMETDSEDETAALEEAEARRLQQARAAALTASDFVDDDDDDDEDDEEEEGEEQKAKERGRKKSKKSKKGKKSDVTGGKLTDMVVETVERSGRHLTKKEKLELIERESPELLELLKEFQTKATELRERVAPLLQSAKAGQLPTKEGVSYLQLKFHLLLSYCLNMSYFLFRKCRGLAVQEHPVVEQLLQLRVLLERLRPLDRKLKYQLDKLLRNAGAAGSGARGKRSSDPLSFKPRAHALEGDGEDDAEEEDDDDSGSTRTYRAPRLAAMPFDEDENRLVAERKSRERARKRLARSEMLADLRRELTDRPDERSHRDESKVEDEEDAARRKHEEENMYRLVLSKKEKAARRKRMKVASRSTLSTLADFEEFGKFDALARAASADVEAEEAAMEADKKRALAHYLNSVDNKRKRRRQSAKHGDADPGIRDPSLLRQLKKPRRMTEEDRQAEALMEAMGMPSPMEMLSEESKAALADYEQQESKLVSAAAKKKRKGRKQRIPQAERSVAEGDRRAISRRIDRNKGLLPYRTKADRNPRVKGRQKFERAKKRRSGVVRKVRTGEAEDYAGEKSGLRKNIAHSVPLR